MKYNKYNKYYKILLRTLLCLLVLQTSLMAAVVSGPSNPTANSIPTFFNNKLLSSSVVIIDSDGDITGVKSITGGDAYWTNAFFTNVFYTSRTLTLNGTNVAMPWASPGKYYITAANSIIFTNITVGITDGANVNITLSNSTASTVHVYVPTNIFMLTNSGSYVALDGFGGTNWDFFLSNSCTAKLVLDPTGGTGLRFVHGYFRTFRP